MNVTISEKTGRMANGAESDHGKVTHARINGAWRALCGTEPGMTADWSSHSTTLDYRAACAKAETLVTCYKCRKALYKYDERPQFGCGTVR